MRWVSHFKKSKNDFKSEMMKWIGFKPAPHRIIVLRLTTELRCDYVLYGEEEHKKDKKALRRTWMTPLNNERKKLCKILLINLITRASKMYENLVCVFF